MGKEKVTFTVDHDLDNWMDENWKKEHYQSKSHMISDAVYLAKCLSEGKSDHPLIKEFLKHAKSSQQNSSYQPPVEKMHCPYGDFDILLMTKTIPPLVQCDYVDNVGKCGHPGNNGKKCTYKKEFK